MARLLLGGWLKRARLTGLANSISGSVGSGGGGSAEMLWILLGSLRLCTQQATRMKGGCSTTRLQCLKYMLWAGIPDEARGDQCLLHPCMLKQCKCQYTQTHKHTDSRLVVCVMQEQLCVLQNRNELTRTGRPSFVADGTPISGSMRGTSLAPANQEAQPKVNTGSSVVYLFFDLRTSAAIASLVAAPSASL